MSIPIWKIDSQALEQDKSLNNGFASGPNELTALAGNLRRRLYDDSVVRGRKGLVPVVLRENSSELRHFDMNAKYSGSIELAETLLKSPMWRLATDAEIEADRVRQDTLRKEAAGARLAGNPARVLG